MEPKQIKKYISKFEMLAEKNGGKINSSVVNEHLEFNDVSSEDTNTIIHKLEDMNLLVVPKGFASMSNAQKRIHRFINDELLPSLMKTRKASLELTEDECKSIIEDQKDKFYVLNRNGHLIKPSCNNTNVTEARKVQELKKMQEQISA